MKIIVAGQDRTKALEPGLASKAAGLRESCSIPHRPAHLDAHELTKAESESEYLSSLLTQLRSKNHVDSGLIEIPCGQGFLRALIHTIRVFLWKLFRYQHDQVIAHQNRVNTYLANALEFEHEFTRKEMAELRKEIEKLRG